MDRLPPRLVRRLVIVPLAFALCLALIAASPVYLLAGAIVDLAMPGRPNRFRTVRLLTFLLGYVVLEVLSFAVMLALWIGSGFGVSMSSQRTQDRHYGFMRWWLLQINRLAHRTFHLRVQIEDPPAPRAGPVLVFARHAGPGNSLLVVGTLLVGYRRHPRIVMLAKLQWEPLYDIMLNRLPNRFIKHDPKRRDVYIDAIAGLASGMGDQDAFVLFPEGKDFTPKVRTRAIDYLRGKGQDEAAERAEKMMNVLPPRHNGVRAATGAAPDADVVLVAHSVLEDVGSFKELWQRIPFDRPVAARYWRFPVSEVPDDEGELISWLYTWWERIDGWITDRMTKVGAD